MPPVFRTAACFLSAVAVSLVPCVATGAEPATASFRERFPASSIDSGERADAALAATAGARGRAEADYKAAARACASDLLVNACLDRERDRQRKRLADIDAVELEANRFKRRGQADRLEADRARRESERVQGLAADSAQRERSRKAFDERQAQARREAADRMRGDASKAASARSRKPAISQRPATPTGADARQRAKNTVDHATKLREAAVHQGEIERRIATKDADRKRRAAEKAAKEAALAARDPKS